MSQAGRCSSGGRRRAFVSCCAFVLALGTCQAPATSNAADATSFGLNESHDGYASQPAHPDKPELRWSRRLGAQVSVPLIGDGRVFLSAYDRATEETFIYALDARTGKTLWRRAGSSGMALSNGRLFVATGGREIQAIDAASGEVLWSKANGQYSGFSAPVATESMVLQAAEGFGSTLYARDPADGTLLWDASVPDGSSPPSVGDGGAYVSGHCGGTTRINLEDGTEAWNRVRGGAFSCSGGLMSVYSAGQIFVREEDSTPPEAVLTSDTGAIARDFRADATPAVTPDLTLALEDGALFARGREEGDELWRYAAPDGEFELPAVVVGDRAAAVSRNGGLAWLNSESGERLWSAEVEGKFKKNDSDAGILSGLSAGNGLLTASGSGVITAFDIGPVEARGPGGPAKSPPEPAASPADSGVTYRLNPARDYTLESDSGLPGKLLWKRDLGVESAYPVLAEGRVYSMTRTADSLVVRAHDRRSGSVDWSYKLPYNEMPFDHDAGLAYSDGRIFVSNQTDYQANGDRIVALDSRTGDELWSIAERSLTPLTPVGDSLYTVGPEGAMSFDANTGEVLWSRTLRYDQSFNATPTVSGDRIFFASSCRETDALNRFTGETIWERSFPACSSGASGQTAPLRGGRLFADDGLALSAETGAILGVHNYYSEWAFTETLTIERRSESLIASDPASGLVAWTFGSGKPISGGPLVVGDYVYVTDEQGELIVLRLEDGEVAMRRDLPVEAEWQSDRYRIPTAFGADRETLAVPLLNGKIAVYPLVAR